MECVYYGYALKTIRELQDKNRESVNSCSTGKVLVSSVTREKNN